MDDAIKSQQPHFDKIKTIGDMVMVAGGFDGDARRAAVAMLAACEAMISAHDRENEWDANYAIGKMRDAIEKARGR